MGLFDFLSGLFGGGDDGDDGGTEDAGDRSRDAGGRSDDGQGGETKDVSEYGPADFRQEAEEFAGDHEDYDLDFSVASLERLDEFATSQTQVMDVLGGEMDEGGELLGMLGEGYTLWWGSYFGEVLVRQFDGEWEWGDEGVHVAVPTGDARTEVPVMDLAAAAVHEEPAFAEVGAVVREAIDRGEPVDFDGDWGAGDDAPAPDPTFPAVDLEPGMDLDAAHERAVEAFEAAGYHVTAGSLMNSVPGNPLEGIAKLFNFHTADEMYTGIVYPGEWDEETTNAVLSLASSLRTDPDLGMDGLHVIAATEPPDGVTYLTGSHPRGAFALEAMVEVQNGPEFAPESVPHYADVGADLLEKYFGLSVDVDDPASLERLDEVVLSELRTVEDHDRPQEGYVPHEALVTIGALAGRVMARALERDLPVRADWTGGEGISSTGVALGIEREGSDEGMVVNPVGKAFKLFESGSEDSLAFMYQTTRAVAEDDLS